MSYSVEIEGLVAHKQRLEARVAELTAALLAVNQSGINSYRNGAKWDDVVIARSAYDLVRAALNRTEEE